MRIGWILTLAAGLWSPASGQTQAPPQPFAALSGVVINDATGAPLRRAVVTLSNVDPTPLEAVTFSESNGAFGFNTIPPGKYRLRVDLDGFQTAWFGAGNSNRPPATFTLAGGDLRYGITFRLRPFGSISGMVLDPDGDPVPSAEVRLIQSGWDRLKPSYVNAGWANSDQNGEYRFAEVPPGQYIVMAAVRYQPALSASEADAGQTEPQKMFGVQFYPDSSRLSSAAPVEMTPGGEIEGIDFHLALRNAATLRGKLVVAGDLPAGVNAMVTVYPQDLPNNSEQTMGAGAIAPDLAFEISNLVTGSYVVAASMQAAGREYRGVEQIELPPGGQEIALHLDRSIDLAGSIEQQGGPPPSGTIHVVLIPGGFPPGRQQIRADVQPDGQFVVPNVTPGVWDINVEPLPSGGFIKSMTLGNYDVLTNDMLIGPGTHEPLRIVVSSRGGVLQGTVTVPPSLARTPRATVMLAPSGRYEQVLSFYAFANADDTGHFEFKGITPGRYKLFAFEELDPSSFGDPGFLKPFNSLSEPFDVREGERLERKTTLIPVGGYGAVN